MSVFHDRYVALGVAVVLVASVFVVFSDSASIEADISGIVRDVKSGSGGCTFYLETEGSSIRCYSTDVPEEMSHYGVIGSFSQDRTIFFVSRLIPNDGR